MKQVTQKVFLIVTFLLGVIAFFVSRGQPNVWSSNSPRIPRIFISGDQEGYRGGGMVALASTDEPAVQIESYNISGTAKVSIFQANEETLLDYLIHDKEGNQIKKDIDVSRFHYITTIDHEVTSGYGNESKLLLPIAESGIWFLRIQLGSASEDSFVVRSDTGVIVKEGDNEYIFWGQNFNTRRSISEGTLRIYNLLDGRKEIATALFDSEGIAKIPLLPEADIALVQRGDDRAVVPINLRHLNSSYNYRSFQPKSRKTKYFIFTDRPLYRHGDTVYFKAILRDDDDVRYSLPAGEALVKIYRGYEETDLLFEKRHSISSAGSVSGEYKLSESFRTGQYRLVVEVPGSTRDEVSFQVEFFRKPEYTLEITTPEKELIAGDKISFRITGNYFSGQPLSNRKVEYSVFSGNFYEYAYFADRPYELSDDYRYGYWGGKGITSGEATLNQQGEAKIDLKAELPSGEKQSQVFSIEAQFDDGSGNPVFTRKNVLVYPGEYSIYRKDYSYGTGVDTPLTLPVILVPHRSTSVSGINLTARIHRENWISYQEPDKKYPSYRKEEEDLPAISTRTDEQGNATFTFVPAKVGSYQITVEGKDGRGNTIAKDFYLWVTSEDQPFYSGEEKKLVIKADKLLYNPSDVARLTISSTIPDRDVFLALERERVNRFQVVHLNGTTGTVDLPLVATDMPNIFAKVSSFSANDYDTVLENLIVSAESKKLVVNITPNQKTFGPQETVVINLETEDTAGNPVSAETAVWAVDKAIFELVDEKPEKIFEAFWQERNNNTQEAHSLEGIAVYSAEMGGCFTPDTPILMVDKILKPISEVRVGDTILTRGSEKDPRLVKTKVANIHSSVVSGYLIINGTLKVTANHRLWVNKTWKEAGSIQLGDALMTSQGEPVLVSSIEWQAGKFKVYNLGTEKYRTYFAGGVWVHNQKGGGARTVFKDTAYWNPAVHTDASGRAQVSFKLPDNLTTWVISAVGATVQTKVGQTSSEIVVTKDIIVRPILPNILREGDEIVLSALVQNFTLDDQTFDIDLKFDSGEIVSAPHAGVLIKAGGMEQVSWVVRPSEENEKAKLTFSAKSKEHPKNVDTVTQKLPVRAFGFFEKEGEVGDGPIEFWVSLAPDAHKQKSTVTLSLAPTLLGTLPVAMKYLVHYPYGCVEQTTSSFVPAVIAKANPDLFASFIADKNIDEIIQSGITRLARLQHGDGGWSWWQAGYSDPFITAYVVEYLAEAKGLGLKIDETILANAQAFLEKEECLSPEGQVQPCNREDLIAKTYGLTFLDSPKGRVRLNDFNDLPSDILALAVVANVKNGDINPATNGLAQLTSLARIQGDGIFWEGGKKTHFGSQDAATALAIRAIVAAGGDREAAVKGVRFLTRNRRAEYWSNTFATAQVVRALVDFSRTGEELTPNYTYTVSLDGKEISRGTVTSSKESIKDIVIPATNIKRGRSEIVITQLGEGQIYSTLLINEFRTDRQASWVNRGLSVKREYVSDKGEEYSLAVGDTVTVKITVSGLKTNEYYGIIADELPSGLVPINPAFKSEQYGQNRSSYYYSYDVTDREITENGMVLSLYQIASGERTYTYKARAVAEGVFTVPPAVASLMYAPEIYGRSEVQTIKVAKTSEVVPAKIPEKVGEYAKEKPGVWLLVSAVLVLLVGIIALFIKLRGRTLAPPT